MGMAYLKFHEEIFRDGYKITKFINSPSKVPTIRYTIAVDETDNEIVKRLLIC